MKDENGYGSVFLDQGTHLMVIPELMIVEPSTGTVLPPFFFFFFFFFLQKRSDSPTALLRSSLTVRARSRRPERERRGAREREREGGIHVSET